MDLSRVIPLSLGRKIPYEGDCVIYVMSRDQRVADNHALLEAKKLADERRMPLVVMFNLLPSLGVRAREHFEFMLDGLEQLAADLKKLNINWLMTYGDGKENILQIADDLKPIAIYFDFNPLSGPRKLAKAVAASTEIPCFVVDTHNIIPTWLASDKQEFAAHTMRGKVHKQLHKWLQEPQKISKHLYKLNDAPKSLSFDEARKKINEITPCGISPNFISGEKAALKHLDDFIKNDLIDYAASRNNIALDKQSNLSPYLHFGQISSLRVALNIMNAVEEPPLLLVKVKLVETSGVPSKEEGMNALFEEMIVRKELADNYCFYNPNYDNLGGAPEWAVKSLKKHENDSRYFIYDREQWEKAKTHDPAWNAAQNQLRRSGKIHGYMRMYWAKKILEWSVDAEDAVKTAIYLNDKYSIDGGDPNGYVGILWSIAGLHDRPWFERSIFGVVRYMNYEGLKRKFDIKKYIEDNPSISSK